MLARLRFLVRALLSSMTSWAAKPWFAYGALMALQLKVTWGAWRVKDLTFGDTCAYFLYARFWTELRQLNIVWHPLYSVFYGTVLEAVGDVYAATILHRLLIALMAGVLVLALMRRLLPAGFAWLVAAWWTVSPINYDTVYEVHLFAVLPFLLAWLVVATWPGAWGRGIGVAIIGAAIVLSRNEMVFSWVVVGLAGLAWDLRQAGARMTSRRRVVLAYAIPFVLAAALCVSFYARSFIQFPALWEAYGPKHTSNMCQVFAAGYAQRNPAWTKNPMTDCEEITVRYFGEAQPTLGRMLRRNPRAMLEHFWWNLGLTPNGVQVLLFNATSGYANPDYFPVHTGSRLALTASVLTAAVVLTGLAVLYRGRREWWRAWLRPRAAAWLFIIATVVPHAAVVILTQRPRPSYLFDLSVCLMGIIGMCGWAICGAWARGRSPATLEWWRTRSALALTGLMVVLVAVAPRHYEDTSESPRPLLRAYRRLAPFAELITRNDAVLLVGEYPVELAHYIAWNMPRTLDYGEAALDAAPKVSAVLDEQKVNVFYVDESMVSRLGPAALFVDRLQATRDVGWELLALEDAPRARWRLWARRGFFDPPRGP
jgi:hypothetical protein